MAKHKAPKKKRGFEVEVEIEMGHKGHKKDKHEKGETRKKEREEHRGKGHKSEKGEKDPKKPKGHGKIAKVMHEYKEGGLHSGSKQGPLVKSKRQALAIAMSEARKNG